MLRSSPSVSCVCPLDLEHILSEAHSFQNRNQLVLHDVFSSSLSRTTNLVIEPPVFESSAGKFVWRISPGVIAKATQPTAMLAILHPSATVAA
jgi:hypothetical protein